MTKHDGVRGNKKQMDRQFFREKDEKRKEIISEEHKYRQSKEEQQIKFMAESHSRDLDWEDHMRQYYLQKHEEMI